MSENKRENKREYPAFSACGLNCGLCPRYHTDGDSRCPGCLGENFYAKHPRCGVLSCCMKHNIEYCHLCDSFPCGKYEKADQTDSFITHKNQLKDLEKIGVIGISHYQEALDEKISYLHKLIAGYNDGRRKGFYCLAVNLLELSDIREVMEVIDTSIAASDLPRDEKIKQIVSLLKAKAKERNIELKLRKK